MVDIDITIMFLRGGLKTDGFLGGKDQESVFLLISWLGSHADSQWRETGGRLASLSHVPVHVGVCPEWLFLQ